MPWRRSVTSQNPILHSINNRLEGIKAEKYGPKLITLANSFYAYLRRRRTSSNPSGRVPSSLRKFSLEERTAYVMRPMIDSSRTHGTRPDSEDFTPSAGLRVRLLPPSTFHVFLLSLFSLLFPPSFSTNPLRADLRFVRTYSMCYSHSLYLGASLTDAYFYGLHAQHMCHTSACTF